MLKIANLAAISNAFAQNRRNEQFDFRLPDKGHTIEEFFDQIIMHIIMHNLVYRYIKISPLRVFCTL